MISTDADPRTPRQSAEAMMRRARQTGDADLMRRAIQVRDYADEMDARRPSQVDHDPYEGDNKFVRGAKVGGWVVGFIWATTLLGVAFFGPGPTIMVVSASTLLLVGGYVAYCAIKRLPR